MNKHKTYKLVSYLMILVVFFAFSTEIQAQAKKINDKAKKSAAQGDLFFRQKDYRNAVNKYTEALSVTPDYSYAHFWKGYAHYYLEEPDLAIGELSKALDEGYKPLEVYKLRWFINFNQKNYDAALSDAEKGLELDASNSNFALGLGDIYNAKGEYQKSIDAYKKGMLLDPNNADAYYFMAQDYSKLGDTEGQGAAAAEAIKKNTKYIGESYDLSGDALLKEKKTDEAIQAYQRAINVKPDLIDAYLKLSDIYRAKSRLDEAIATVKKGIKLFPDNGLLYTSLSWYYSLNGHNVESIAAAQKAIALLPNESTAYTNLCRVYNDTQQYPQAIESCSAALKINPDDGETNFYIARAYDYTNKRDTATPFYKKAVAGLEKFTADNSDDPDGFYLLGNAYFADGDKNKAIEAYKKSLDLSPKFAKAIYNLGYTYFVNQNEAAAREQYDALLKIDARLAGKLKQAMDNK